MTPVEQSVRRAVVQPPRHGLGTLILLAAGTFAVGTGGYVVAGVLPDIARSLNVSLSTASLLISIYAVVFAVGSPVIAVFIPRISRTTLMVGGLVVYSLGHIAASLLPTFELVLASRLLGAVGAAAFVPAAMAGAAAMVAPERRGRAIAVVAGGFSAATALGAPMGTAIGAIFSWHASLWFVVIVGLAAAAGLALVLRDVPIPESSSFRARLAPLVRPRVFWPLVTMLLLVAGQYSAYTFFGAVHERATGGDGAMLAILLFVYGATSTVGNLIAGSLCDRFGNRVVVNVSMTVLVLTFIATPFMAGEAWGAAVAIALWGFSSAAAALGLQHRVVQGSPAGIAWVSSAIYFGVALSGSIGTFAIATVGAHYLTEIAVIAVVIAAVVGEVSYALIVRYKANRD